MLHDAETLLGHLYGMFILCQCLFILITWSAYVNNSRVHEACDHNEPMICSFQVDLYRLLCTVWDLAALNGLHKWKLSSFFFITGKVSRTLSTRAKVSYIECNTETSATLHLGSQLPYDLPLTYKKATGLVSQIPKWHSAVDGFCFGFAFRLSQKKLQKAWTHVFPFSTFFFLSLELH